MQVNMEMKRNIYWDDAAECSIIDTRSENEDPSLNNDDTAPSKFSRGLLRCELRCEAPRQNHDLRCYDRSVDFRVNILGGGISEDDDRHQQTKKRRVPAARDPMSHRIIEKRRRDRMNNCLADLSKLIPTEYMRKNRGRIEKTEIIEMAIEYLKYLKETKDRREIKDHRCDFVNDEQFSNGAGTTCDPESSSEKQYKSGYRDCVTETMRFLEGLQGFSPEDALRKMLPRHLQRCYEKLNEGMEVVSLVENEHFSNFEVAKTNSYSVNVSEQSERGDNCFRRTSSDSSNRSNYDCGNGHQSGEMIVSPHLNTLHIPATVKPNLITLLSREPSSQIDSTNCSHASNGSLYKFKSNIRDRFEHSMEEKRSTPMILCRTVRQSLFSSSSSSSGFSEQPFNNEDRNNRPNPIPIFAFHSKGSFYVPLTVDSDILAPFIPDLDNDRSSKGISSLLLHPVTISVNFNHTSQSTSVNFSSGISEESLLEVPEYR